MKRDKKSLIIGLIIGLIVSFFYCYFFAPRYEVKKDGLSMIKIDRWTGQSWVFMDNNWKKMVNMGEEWEQIDKTLSDALKIPFAQVDSQSALQKLRETYPILKDIPNDELLERIKLVYSKKVLVNMYLGDFLKTKEDTASETSDTVK